MSPLRKPWLEKRAVFTWLGPYYILGRTDARIRSMYGHTYGCTGAGICKTEIMPPAMPNPVHTADARRQCVHNSQLVGDSLNESEQISQQRSRVKSCRWCEHTYRQSWPSLQFPMLLRLVTSDDIMTSFTSTPTRRNSTVASRQRRRCVLDISRISSILRHLQHQWP